MWCQVRAQFHSFACGYPVLPAPFVEKTALSSFNGLSTLVENHLAIHARVYFWPFCSIHWSLYLLLYQYHTFLIIEDFVTFKIRTRESSNFVLFQHCLASWGSLIFYMNFRMDFYILEKNIIGILIWIALKLQIALGSVDIFSNIFFQSMNKGYISIQIRF